MIYWVLKTVVLGPILRLLFRPWVEGAEHVPETGPAIFASNHLSFSDSIFLPLVVPRRITFLAKSDYFTSGGLKGRLKAGFFRSVGQLPVDRSGGRASQAKAVHSRNTTPRSASRAKPSQLCPASDGGVSPWPWRSCTKAPETAPGPEFRYL